MRHFVILQLSVRHIRHVRHTLYFAPVYMYPSNTSLHRPTPHDHSHKAILAREALYEFCCSFLKTAYDPFMRSIKVSLVILSSSKSDEWRFALSRPAPCNSFDTCGVAICPLLYRNCCNKDIVSLVYPLTDNGGIPTADAPSTCAVWKRLRRGSRCSSFDGSPPSYFFLSRTSFASTHRGFNPRTRG